MVSPVVEEAEVVEEEVAVSRRSRARPSQQEPLRGPNIRITLPVVSARPIILSGRLLGGARTPTAVLGKTTLHQGRTRTEK